jgi:RNA polymerase sigma factor (sigma-70 family)
MAAARLGAVLRHIRHLTADPNSGEPNDGALLRAFLSRNDQGAFEALVRRHGPMVLRVCRRALNNAHDAEDALQATFLLLARRAASIRKRESLASWLHGVASRMAADARKAAARRHRHESRAHPAPPPDPALSAAWKELQALLDEEIARLPETLRGPFVLCCLENQSCAEAARRLGLEEGAVAMRLSRARKRLQGRLARRGVALTAVLAAVALGANGASAAVPRSVVGAIVKAAARVGAGHALTGNVVSGQVLALVEGVDQTMFLSKCKTAILLLVFTALVGTGLGLAVVRGAAGAERALPGAAGEQSQNERPPADAPADKGGAEVRGRVLDPDGKPVAGAKLYLGHYGPKDELVVSERAKSDADGRFQFTFDKSQLSKAHPEQPIARVPNTRSFAELQPFVEEAHPFFAPVGQVMAVAEGLGCDWVRLDPAAGSSDLTLRLVKDVPISGRVLDQEGKPIAGAKLRLSSFHAYPDGGLDESLKRFRQSNIFPGGVKRWGGPLPGRDRVATTGQDGRFRMTGLGAERFVNLHIEGPGIGAGDIQVMTRASDEVAGPDKVDLPTGKTVTVVPRKVYGANFRYLAAASRPIRVVVTDKETGKPLPDVSVRVLDAQGYLLGNRDMLATRTDREGCYELLGGRKSARYEFVAQPADSGHYFAVTVKVEDTPGFTPLTANIKLTRGVTVRGKVLEERTGKPVPGAKVLYYPLHPNAATRAFNDYFSTESAAVAGADGSFAVAALPGPGVLGTVAPDSTAYAPIHVTPKELDDFFKKHKAPPPEGSLGEQYVLIASRPLARAPLAQRSFNSLVLVHPGEKDKEVKQDVALRPRAGDGKPEDAPRKDKDQ